MNKKVLASAGILALALGAKADLITQEQSYSAQSYWTQGLTFDQFNPQLGNLNSVTVDLTGNVQLNSSVNNNGVAAVDMNLSDDFVLTASVPGGPLMLTKELDQNFLVGVGASMGDMTSGTVSQNETLSGDLSAWEGLGSIILPANVSDSLAYNVVLGNTVNVTPTAGLDATVTFNYSAVPDGPLPVWASLGGILPVLWLAARQKSRLAV